MDIKKEYAENLAKPKNETIYLNKRLFDTYNSIVDFKLNTKLFGTNIDLGSGDKGFSEVCRINNIISYCNRRIWLHMSWVIIKIFKIHLPVWSSNK